MASNKDYEVEQARSEVIFDNIGTGAIATDELGRIYKINDVALDMLDLSRKKVIGSWLPKIVVEVDGAGNIIKNIDRPITRAFINGKSISENTYYKTKGGKIIPVSVTVSPILLNDRPIGAVAVFQDITVEFEVDRMKTEFISIASHQLRTPLSAINTYANMLNAGYYGELNEDQSKYMKTILTSVDRMNGIISTLLDVSQIEAGKINVKPQIVNVTDLIETLVKDLSQSAEKKQISIKKDLPKKPVVVTIDRLLLGEIYSNLISNAFKYSHIEGKVEIKLKNTTDEIIFSVKDNGFGIPKHLHKNIFSKFYRAENVKKIDTSGTGLGLYHAKQIADALGGRLWFESRQKKGSTFYFSLPK